MHDLVNKLRPFALDVVEIDGHDSARIQATLAQSSSARPRCIVLHTVKGRGLSDMENTLQSHYLAPSEAQVSHALSYVHGGTQ
jgi:transketolase